MNISVEPRKHLLHPVVVLGGSGDVGRRLAHHLSKFWPGRVILAGRHVNALKSVAALFGPSVDFCMIDASRSEHADMLPNDSYVISLTEASTPAFVQNCLDRGVSYIDSSASQPYTETLEMVGRQSRGRGRLILFAGLMPGLTNSIADAMVTGSPEITKLETIVQFGLGRHHGAAATEWVLRALGETYLTWQNGMSANIKSGALMRRYRYRGSGRTFVAIGVGSNDQVVSGNRNKLRHCHTYVAFDSRIISVVLATFLKCGWGGVLSRHARRITEVLNKLPKIGTVGTRLSVFGYGAHGELLSRREFAGGDQADIASLMLAETALSAQVLSTSHLTVASELVNADTALSALARAGLLDSITSSIEDAVQNQRSSRISS